MSATAWEPRDGIEAFIDRCVERRARGWTWRKIALHEYGSENQPTGFSTLNAWFAKNPEAKKKIDSYAEQETIENIRQTLTEVAIDNKDRQILIHLSKAKLKNYEAPAPTQVEQKEELVQAMSPEQARLELAKLALPKPEPENV